MKLRTATFVAALLCATSGADRQARAQFSVPITPQKIDGATLFTRQCGTCHIATAEGTPRPGPRLFGVYGRRAGTLAGFKYKGKYEASGIVWDETSLDTYLTNPQAMIPGAIMAYRQADPDVRHTIIAWLKEQH